MRLFTASKMWTVGGGGGPSGPPVVRPPMKLELYIKKERAALDKRKPVVPNFKVSGQPVTSETGDR